ncbi:MAG TPA: M48 family metallopeptidase [Candidatus Sulfotelmatobacter sp.]|nr:M48 family metallopeptidase [Candidatus Sulfotelmatobacter sp.]
MTIAARIVRCRRKSIALIVTEDAQLVVRAPWHIPHFYIRSLLAKRQDWIERKIAEVKNRPKLPPLSPEERAALIGEAEKVVRERCGWFAARTGWQPAGIRISNARRRWGSCGINGTLHFSWRLARAPLPVIDYVVVHELAHLAERNHSRRFWAKVAAVLPDFRRQRRWLRKNGHLLNG